MQTALYLKNMEFADRCFGGVCGRLENHAENSGNGFFYGQFSGQKQQKHEKKRIFLA